MQGANGEQEKTEHELWFWEAHTPCWPFCVVLFYKAEQNHNPGMANKGYVQIFGKGN